MDNFTLPHSFGNIAGTYLNPDHYNLSKRLIGGRTFKRKRKNSRKFYGGIEPDPKKQQPNAPPVRKRIAPIIQKQQPNAPPPTNKEQANTPSVRKRIAPLIQKQQPNAPPVIQKQQANTPPTEKNTNHKVTAKELDDMTDYTEKMWQAREQFRDYTSITDEKFKKIYKNATDLLKNKRVLELLEICKTADKEQVVTRLETWEPNISGFHDPSLANPKKQKTTIKVGDTAEIYIEAYTRLKNKIADVDDNVSRNDIRSDSTLSLTKNERKRLKELFSSGKAKQEDTNAKVYDIYDEIKTHYNNIKKVFDDHESGKTSSNESFENAEKELLNDFDKLYYDIIVIVKGRGFQGFSPRADNNIQEIEKMKDDVHTQYTKLCKKYNKQAKKPIYEIPDTSGEADYLDEMQLTEAERTKLSQIIKKNNATLDEIEKSVTEAKNNPNVTKEEVEKLRDDYVEIRDKVNDRQDVNFDEVGKTEEKIENDLNALFQKFDMSLFDSQGRLPGDDGYEGEVKENAKGDIINEDDSDEEDDDYEDTNEQDIDPNDEDEDEITNAELEAIGADNVPKQQAAAANAEAEKAIQEEAKRKQEEKNKQLAEGFLDILKKCNSFRKDFNLRLAEAIKRPDKKKIDDLRKDLSKFRDNVLKRRNELLADTNLINNVIRKNEKYNNEFEKLNTEYNQLLEEYNRKWEAVENALKELDVPLNIAKQITDPVQATKDHNERIGQIEKRTEEKNKEKQDKTSTVNNNNIVDNNENPDKIIKRNEQVDQKQLNEFEKYRNDLTTCFQDIKDNAIDIKGHMLFEITNPRNDEKNLNFLKRAFDNSVERYRKFRNKNVALDTAFQSYSNENKKDIEDKEEFVSKIVDEINEIYEDRIRKINAVIAERDKQNQTQHQQKQQAAVNSNDIISSASVQNENDEGEKEKEEEEEEEEEEENEEDSDNDSDEEVEDDKADAFEIIQTSGDANDKRIAEINNNFMHVAYMGLRKVNHKLSKFDITKYSSTFARKKYKIYKKEYNKHVNTIEKYKGIVKQHERNGSLVIGKYNRNIERIDYQIEKARHSFKDLKEDINLHQEYEDEADEMTSEEEGAVITPAENVKQVPAFDGNRDKPQGSIGSTLMNALGNLARGKSVSEWGTNANSSSSLLDVSNKNQAATNAAPYALSSTYPTHRGPKSQLEKTGIPSKTQMNAMRKAGIDVAAMYGLPSTKNTTTTTSSVPAAAAASAVANSNYAILPEWTNKTRTLEDYMMEKADTWAQNKWRNQSSDYKEKDYTQLLNDRTKVKQLQRTLEEIEAEDENDPSIPALKREIQKLKQPYTGTKNTGSTLGKVASYGLSAAKFAYDNYRPMKHALLDYQIDRQSQMFKKPIYWALEQGLGLVDGIGSAVLGRGVHKCKKKKVKKHRKYKVLGGRIIPPKSLKKMF
jgi:hypothetical protein